MAKPKKCTTSSQDEQAAQEHINQKKVQIELEIDSLIDEHFGRVFDNTSALNTTVTQKNIDKRNNQARIKYLQKNRPPNWYKEVNQLKQRVKQDERDLSKAKTSLRDLKQKKIVGNNLINLLKERMLLSAQKHVWNIDVSDIVNVLKLYLSNRMGPFNSINDLSYPELNAKYNMLKKWFKNQDDGIMPTGFRGQGMKASYQYTMVDPAKVIIMNDKSLKGLSLIKEIQDNLPKKSERKSFFRKKYAEIQDTMSTFLYNNNIIFENDGRKWDELTQSEKIQNMEKINEFISDLLDGKVKYVVPKSIKNLISPKNKELFEKYAAIVAYANNSGFNVSKDIHEVRDGDEVYYYVTMKNVDESTGKEEYYAFLVPHYLDDNGRTKFYYPASKKGAKNGKWLSSIPIKAGSSAKDITDVMIPGFRKAEVDKIFNGYNKNQREINVKGYADYNQMSGMDINHPMFNQDIINKGTSQKSVESMWLHIKKVRELLDEIFQDWQEMAQGTLDRVSNVVNTHAGLRDIIINKGVAAEEVDENVAKILNILDFSSMMWIDPDTGEVNSPNITSGIAENYYPTMYDYEVSIAQLAGAIMGIRNEISLLIDKRTQLNNLEEKETDPDLKAKYKKQLINVDKKLKEYVGYNITNASGEVERNPGVFELMTAELDLSLGLITKEEMPGLSAQSMVAYGKHRKLWTRRIKPLTPGTIYGGKRTDANVINEMIDNVYETTFNNQIKAALLEAIPVIDPAVLDFLVEEVKAALGRHDVRSGIMGLDYSNEKIMKVVKKISPNTKMTVERIHQSAANLSTRISGSLLGVSTALQNRMQEFLGGVIEIGPMCEMKVMEIMGNKDMATDIAQQAGVLDTIQTLSDVFLGGLETQLTFTDGFHTTKDFILLKTANLSGWLNSKNIESWLIRLIKTREGDKTEITKENLLHIKEGVFELVHGVADGTLTDEQLQALYGKLSRIAGKQYIRWYAQWGMGAFGLGDTIPGLKGAKQYLSMTEGEKEMRTIMAVRGSVFYADYIAPEDQRGNYTSHDALEFARALVNNTLFQFSTQYFPKIFRGIGGMLSMKFKTYYYMESKRELEILNNFWNMIRGLKLPDGRPDRARQISEFRKVFGSPTEGYPFIGYHPDDVYSFSLEKNGPYPWLGKGNRGMDSDSERLRKLFWSRTMASLWLVGTISIFRPMRWLGNFVHKKFQISPTVLGRGAESTLASLGLRGIRLLLGSLALGMDDEDEDAKQLYRIFLPIYLNVIYDSIKGKGSMFNPFTLTRIGAGWMSESLQAIYEHAIGEKME